MTLLKRLWPLLLLAALFAAIFATGLNRYLTLETLRTHEEGLTAAVRAHFLTSLVAFVAIYALATTASIPGASILTLSGGFLFGTWVGGVATVIGATIGAVALYYVIRSALGETLLRRIEAKNPTFRGLVDGVRANAFSYILSLRLIPFAPFWLVNAAAGLAQAPVGAYALATFLGIMPATFIYAGVGSGLHAVFARGEKADLTILLEPRVYGPLLGLALLALLPALVRRLRTRRAAA